jgi:hypothetical protein
MFFLVISKQKVKIIEKYVTIISAVSVIHVRGASVSSITQDELTNFMQHIEGHLKSFIDLHEKLDDDEAKKLDAKMNEMK